MNNSNDLLIDLIKKKDTEKALELIQSNQFNPEYVDNIGNTALILACNNSLNDVALALIQTRQSKPEQVNSKGETALHFAEKNNMFQVIEMLKQELQKLINQRRIDVTQEGFDAINQRTVIIQDYLSENENNLCFKIHSNCYLINKTDLDRQLNDKMYQRFECRKAGDGSQYILDENIIRDTVYFMASSLFGLRIVVPMKEMKNIIKADTTEIIIMI